MQLLPRDCAVVTSHPIRSSCRKINPLFADRKMCDAAVSPAPGGLQSEDQLATAASGPREMQCNDLIPNGCRHKWRWQIDPVSSGSVLPSLNCYGNSAPTLSYCPLVGFSSTARAVFEL